jgi:hypothetical protein
MASAVRLHLYFERSDSGPTWWSESPDVPGFHATAKDMQNVILRSKFALAEILADDVDLTVQLIGQPPDTEGDPPATATGELYRAIGTTKGTPGVHVMAGPRSKPPLTG